jgi:NAD+ synthase (glutamine-hydrolysing)
MMRIALAQLNFTVGAFDANLRRIEAAVARARSAEADLVVFSEMAATGYPPRDLLYHASFVERNLALRDRVATFSDDDLGIVLGCVEPNPALDAKPLFNAAVLCHRGRIVARHRKTLLPTYDVFDEDRYFEPGTTLAPVEFKGLRLGLTICEEIWSDPSFWPRRLYARDPVSELATAGVDVLINVSSSPFTMGKAAIRRDVIREHAARHRCPFVYVNQVGGNDELIFDGHSLGIDGGGRTSVRLRDFEEDFGVFDVPRAGSAALVSPALADVADSREEEAHRALVLGLRDYVAKCGFTTVVLGLSGGIDSALTAALAAEALGAGNVTGIAMPTRYSSELSLRDAEMLAGNLGIAFHVVSIDTIFQSYLDTLAPVLPGPPGVAEENLQARIRGATLMAFSNKHGAMLLSTGNKSELAVGYCTLYGDMCGGLAAISDVPKTLVYSLARHMNRHRLVIPESSLSKPPSAELRFNQTDQDTLPPYDDLDRIVEAYVERGLDIDQTIAEGLDAALVRDVAERIDRNEYKRRQAAPGLKITSKAFGVGRRYPIAADYRALTDVLDAPV